MKLKQASIKISYLDSQSAIDNFILNASLLAFLTCSAFKLIAIFGEGILSKVKLGVFRLLITFC